MIWICRQIRIGCKMCKHQGFKSMPEEDWPLWLTHRWWHLARAASPCWDQRAIHVLVLEAHLGLLKAMTSGKPTHNALNSLSSITSSEIANWSPHNICGTKLLQKRASKWTMTAKESFDQQPNGRASSGSRCCSSQSASISILSLVWSIRWRVIAENSIKSRMRTNGIPIWTNRSLVVSLNEARTRLSQELSLKALWNLRFWSRREMKKRSIEKAPRMMTSTSSKTDKTALTVISNNSSCVSHNKDKLSAPPTTKTATSTSSNNPMTADTSPQCSKHSCSTTTSKCRCSTCSHKCNQLVKGNQRNRKTDTKTLLNSWMMHSCTPFRMKNRSCRTVATFCRKSMVTWGGRCSRCLSLSIRSRVILRRCRSWRKVHASPIRMAVLRLLRVEFLGNQNLKTSNNYIVAAKTKHHRANQPWTFFRAKKSTH